MRFFSAFLRFVCAGNGKSQTLMRTKANNENLFVIEYPKKYRNERRSDEAKRKGNSPAVKFESCERKDQTKTAVTLTFDPTDSVFYSSLFTRIFVNWENERKQQLITTFFLVSLQVIPSGHNLQQNDEQLEAHGEGEDYQNQGPAGPFKILILIAALLSIPHHFPGLFFFLERFSMISALGSVFELCVREIFTTQSVKCVAKHTNAKRRQQ